MPNSVIFEVPPSPRHTSHVFLLVLCVFSSVPTFLGKARGPGTMESLLPNNLVLFWAAILTMGSIISLVGVYWRHRLTGLLIEQIGMLCVSVATIYYVGILYSQVGLDSLQNSAMVLGFGIACGWRYRQIQKYFNQVKEARLQAEQKQLEATED